MAIRLFVTGAAGFIGSYLTRRLLDQGHHVVGFDNMNDYYPVCLKKARVDRLIADRKNFIFIERDLCNLDELRKAFKKYKPESVVHLAAQAGVRYSITNPFVYQKSNLEGFLNLLECCREFRVRRFVYASSSSVYGGNKKLPFSESDNVDSPISLYAATKKANELIAHSYTHLYQIQTIGLRFFTVYGPWGRPDMAMWIFSEKIQSDQPIPVFNNGIIKRDFTFIDDIIDGTCKAVFTENLDPFEIFNLGNHRCEDLMDMIAILEQSMGKKAQLDLQPAQPGDVAATYADIARSQQKLSFMPTTPIADGIPKFCQWYRDNPGIADEVREWRNSSSAN